MKGLIYKDLQIMKNNGKLLLAACILAFFLMLGSDAGSAFFVNYIMLFSTILSLNTLSYDEMNHGMSYLLTLPVKRSTYVREKYVLALLFDCGAWVIGFPVSFWLSKGGDFAQILWSSLVVLLLVCVMFSLMIPIQIKVGGENARIAVFSVVLGIVLIGYLADFVLKSFHVRILETAAGFVNESPGAALGAGAALTVMILLISMGISIMIINKKEY